MNSNIEDKLLNILGAYSFVTPKIDAKLDSLSGGSYAISSVGKKYVLKIYSNPAAASREARIMSRLSQTLSTVPAVLENTQGNLVSVADSWSCVVYEFSAGREIGWDESSALIPISLSQDLAQNLSNIRDALSTFQIEAPKNIQSMKKAKVTGADLMTRYRIAQRQLQLLNLENFKHGLIHSDLTRENIFVDSKSQKVTGIVDFGDAHYDILVWDIAVLITQIFITKSWGIDWQAIETFMQEYNHLQTLQSNEKNALLPLMIVRNIQLLEEAQSNRNEANSKMLRSIELSVLTKLLAIEKNSQRLAALLTL